MIRCLPGLIRRGSPRETRPQLKLLQQTLRTQMVCAGIRSFFGRFGMMTRIEVGREVYGHASDFLSGSR
jgi:hypothetical protein